MRKIFFTLTLAVLCLSAAAQTYTPSAANLEAREEFSNYKFGIFIHWGLYSMLGDGEWIMNVKNLNYEEYAKLAGGFYPSKFDAKEWVTTFKNAGAKYMTITTRHHDGFSMFDTRQSDFNIVKATPFGRDIIGELAEACKDQGLALHFYYSHLDWTRLDYWPLGREGHGVGRPEGKSGDWDKYIQFMENQFTELIQNYHPKAMWFDGIWDKKGDSREDQYKLWKLEEQYELIHRLDPACLIGNNHHQIPFPGEDIEIFEQDLPGKNEGGFSGSQGIAENFPLETCRTMNNSWGYSITDKAYRDSRELIQYLVKASGKGANLLLNIGPRPDGKLPDEAVSHLKDIGDWLRVYGDAIYDTDGGYVGEQPWGVTTQRGNVLFIHILNPQQSIQIPVKGKNKLTKAVTFDGRAKVTFKQGKESINITVPAAKGEPIDQILILTFKNKL